jgi:hypothetical protein
MNWDIAVNTFASVSGAVCLMLMFVLAVGWLFGLVGSRVLFVVLALGLSGAALIAIGAAT